MAHLYKDQYTWFQGFNNVSSSTGAGDPPQATQFPGGRNKSALLIDYELTLSNAAGTTTLVVYLYNEKRNTYQEWYVTPLQEGNHRIKIDIHGSPGGLKVKDVSQATLDWLDWTIVDRETGGN